MLHRNENSTEEMLSGQDARPVAGDRTPTTTARRRLAETLKLDKRLFVVAAFGADGGIYRHDVGAGAMVDETSALIAFSDNQRTELRNKIRCNVRFDVNLKIRKARCKFRCKSHT